MNNNDIFEKIILRILLSCSDDHKINTYMYIYIYYVNRPNGGDYFIIFYVATIVFGLIDSVNFV